VGGARAVVRACFELAARGAEGFGMYGLSILKDLVLPQFPQIASRPAWPPPRNVSGELGLMVGQMSASLGDPRSTTADWFKVKEDEERARIEAAERQRAEAEAAARARIDDRNWHGSAPPP
jgi:hypothetical protein